MAILQPYPPAGPSAPERPSPEQWQLARRCLAAMGVFWVMASLGTAFSLWLVNHEPLLLVALSPLGRHVLLGAAVADPVALLAVTTVRRTAFYTTTFFLGRALGPWAIQWVEARSRHMGRFVRFIERLFEMAPRTVVLLGTGPTVSALAGMSGMRLRTFWLLGIPGLAVRLAVWIAFAEVLRGPIEELLALIEEYWIPGTVVMVVGVAIHQWYRVRAARAARTAPAEGAGVGLGA